MIKQLTQCALVSLALLPCATAAEPVKLTLAYFSSDRTLTYLTSIKPFADAVNDAAADSLRIDIAFGGALAKNPAEQLQLVLAGNADLAFVIPGYTPEHFPDNAVVELPGLFSDMREATLVYTSLIAANALRGYDELLVVGAFATQPETIHTRPPVASLEALKGMRIRSNNPTQSAVLAKLGMAPIRMPINQAASAISRGALDGAMVPPAPLIEFGIARVTPNHYLLGVSSAPLLLVMNRKKFDSLPEQAQQIIRKYSGQWVAERYIEASAVENDLAIASLKKDPNRNVVIPSPADLERAHAVFESEVEAWAAVDPRHGQLLKLVQAELQEIRAGGIGSQ